MKYAYNLRLTTDKSIAKAWRNLYVSELFSLENEVENISDNWCGVSNNDNIAIYLFISKSAMLQLGKREAVFSAVEKETINAMADDLKIKNYENFIKSCAPLNLSPCQ